MGWLHQLASALSHLGEAGHEHRVFLLYIMLLVARALECYGTQLSTLSRQVLPLLALFVFRFNYVDYLNVLALDAPHAATCGLRRA